MQKRFKVGKGKELVGLSVAEHTFVRLLDRNGHETFRFDSPGEHVTAVVSPGLYRVDTDGQILKIELTSVERLRRRSEFDSTKPPLGRPGMAP